MTRSPGSSAKSRAPTFLATPRSRTLISVIETNDRSMSQVWTKHRGKSMSPFSTSPLLIPFKEAIIVCFEERGAAMPSKKPKVKKTPSSSETVDREAVVRLAYELYVQRGYEPGHDVEDWLMAEQILAERETRSAPGKKTSAASRRPEDKLRRR
ncbi:MAG: DUF2934 domain-containing protein [Nitrospirae bacterium]|nr:MAG: DUF2934 domain-containing protein [Nitrospirota bacterium]